jgi:DNA-binding response OmpR family regulator
MAVPSTHWEDSNVNPGQNMQPTILVIDESAVTRKVLEIALGRAGFTVHSYRDGISALRAVVTGQEPPPALLLLDVALPRMDGYAIAQYVRRMPALAGVPIIMLSAHSGVLDRLKGRLAGACAYLSKPISTQELLAVVRQVLQARARPPARGSGPPMNAAPGPDGRRR